MYEKNKISVLISVIKICCIISLVNCDANFVVQLSEENNTDVAVTNDTTITEELLTAVTTVSSGQFPTENGSSDSYDNVQKILIDNAPPPNGTNKNFSSIKSIEHFLLRDAVPNPPTIANTTNKSSNKIGSGESLTLESSFLKVRYKVRKRDISSLISQSQAEHSDLIGDRNRTTIAVGNNGGESVGRNSRDFETAVEKRDNDTNEVNSNLSVIIEGKHSKNKKKKKGGSGWSHMLSHMGHSLMKFPKFMHKVGMSKGGMFMMGMMQANLYHFVMQVLWMSKMALSSVFMMFLREVVFADKDNPVKYYNFGYEKPPSPPVVHDEPPSWSSSDHYDHPYYLSNRRILSPIIGRPISNYHDAYYKYRRRKTQNYIKTTTTYEI